MESYGLLAKGALVTEQVNTLPSWTSNDQGRILFEISSSIYYLGGPNISTGYDGWIPVGLSERCIIYPFIDWDDQVEGNTQKVSSLNIPALYKDEVTNIQDALDTLTDRIDGFITGTYIEPKSIKKYHIDFEGPFAITASDIPVSNTTGLFTGENLNVQTTLEQLISNKTASQIALDEGGTFGSAVGLNAIHVQRALEQLEQYIALLNAADINATYPGNTETTDIQSVLNVLFNTVNSVNFKDLIGTPENYGNSGQFLMTDGISSLCFTNLVANYVQCQYPGVNVTNVQSALALIDEAFVQIQDTLTNVLAGYINITYENGAVTNSLPVIIDELFHNDNSKIIEYIQQRLDNLKGKDVLLNYADFIGQGQVNKYLNEFVDDVSYKFNNFSTKDMKLTYTPLMDYNYDTGVETRGDAFSISFHDNIITLNDWLLRVYYFFHQENGIIQYLESKRVRSVINEIAFMDYDIEGNDVQRVSKEYRHDVLLQKHSDLIQSLNRFFEIDEFQNIQFLNAKRIKTPFIYVDPISKVQTEELHDMNWITDHIGNITAALYLMFDWAEPTGPLDYQAIGLKDHIKVDPNSLDITFNIKNDAGAIVPVTAPLPYCISVLAHTALQLHDIFTWNNYGDEYLNAEITGFQEHFFDNIVDNVNVTWNYLDPEGNSQTVPVTLDTAIQILGSITQDLHKLFQWNNYTDPEYMEIVGLSDYFCAKLDESYKTTFPVMNTATGTSENITVPLNYVIECLTHLALEQYKVFEWSSYGTDLKNATITGFNESFFSNIVDKVYTTFRMPDPNNPGVYTNLNITLDLFNQTIGSLVIDFFEMFTWNNFIEVEDADIVSTSSQFHQAVSNAGTPFADHIQTFYFLGGVNKTQHLNANLQDLATEIDQIKARLTAAGI